MINPTPNISSNPLVSVIIPFFSRFDWLKEAVCSVLSQTYHNYEIIIVNDGSLEDDKTFLEEFGSRVIYKKKNNEGPGAARNYGIEFAQGKYVAFLDSDDIWLPDKLEKQISLMERVDAVWSHTSYFVFDEEDAERNLTTIDTSGFYGQVFPKCLLRLAIGTPCVIIKREALLNLKHIRFSEAMRFGQDAYMWCLLSIEFPLYVLNESLTMVRRTGGNAVSRARAHLKLRAGLWQNLISNLTCFNPNANVDLATRIVYQYCFMVNWIIDAAEKTLSIRGNVQEILAKIAYIPAYFFFRLSFSKAA